MNKRDYVPRRIFGVLLVMGTIYNIFLDTYYRNKSQASLSFSVYNPQCHESALDEVKLNNLVSLPPPTTFGLGGERGVDGS